MAAVEQRIWLRRKPEAPAKRCCALKGAGRSRRPTSHRFLSSVPANPNPASGSEAPTRAPIIPVATVPPAMPATRVPRTTMPAITTMPTGTTVPITTTMPIPVAVAPMPFTSKRRSWNDQDSRQRANDRESSNHWIMPPMLDQRPRSSAQKKNAVPAAWVRGSRK
jgi:hypothetical protein